MQCVLCKIPSLNVDSTRIHGQRWRILCPWSNVLNVLSDEIVWKLGSQTAIR